MESNLLIPLLTIVLPLLGAGAGYLIKENIEKKKDLLNEVNKERRELYQQFVDLIIDVFSGTKTGKQNKDIQLIQKLFVFYKKYVLYASPEVINSFSDYFQYLYSADGQTGVLDHKIHFRKLSRIMFEMRKDLGLSNKNLGKDGEKLFRALITDFDKVMN
ncbi:hypothetical protein [Cesiribacter sp. SM1]|uniref:hypothetical protein n=1 Tax=Cesiribacter sp. SM1 TaxID=2861196 RepID=UPI001CD72AE7|nr:hypothetical protein [Cesiribacter sp. SM1]